jgi:hypothetical protein
MGAENHHSGALASLESNLLKEELMASDVVEARKAEAELLRQLEACEEEAKKPRPAPPPQQYVRGIPIGHAPAGMPPDPCADLRKRYAEAKKALEDAVDRERDLDKPPIYETEEDEQSWKDVPEDVWWKKKPLSAGPGTGLGDEMGREWLRHYLRGLSSEEIVKFRQNANAQAEKDERAAKGPAEVSRVRSRIKRVNEEIDREEKRRKK